MKFTFFHAGDLFLDSPFVGLRGAPPPIAEILRDASLDALDALVNAAIERDVPFLIIAGRLADPTRGLSLRAQLRLREGLERLSRKHIQVFLLQSPDLSPDARERVPALGPLPENVTVFGTEGRRVATAEFGGPRDVFVHGRSEPNAPPRENPVVGFERGEEGGFHVGVARCPARFAGDAWKCLPDLAHARRVNLDYWALALDTDGSASGPHPASFIGTERPAMVYAGSIQERWAEDAIGGERGVVLVKVKDRRIRRMEILPIDKVRVVSADARALAEDPSSDLSPANALRKQLEQLRRANSGQTLIVRGLLPRTNAPVPDLLRDLRAESENTRPHVWWDSIGVDPRPSHDRGLFDRREDFAADLVNRAASYDADETKLAEFVETRASRLREDGLDPSLLALGASERRSLLRKAEKDALRMLEEESAP